MFAHPFTRRSLLSTALLCALAAAGCSKTNNASSVGAASDLPVVGIVQLVEHEALDASVSGFIESLKKHGFEDGVTVRFDRQNAQGDQETLKNITARFVSEKAKLIFAVSTPAAQAAARGAKNTPIVATAVTSFTAAKLAESDEAPNGNVTGVSNIGPIDRQFDLLMKLTGGNPEKKPFGIIYNTGEVNSTFQAEIFKSAAKAAGVPVLEASASSVNDIQQAVLSLTGKVAGLWFPTDNVLASGAAILAKAANDARIPTVPGDSALVRQGLLATIAVDYPTLGRMSGDMAAEILTGKNVPAKMPIQRQEAQAPIINLKTAAAIGLTIPKDVLEGAETLR